MLRLQVFFRMLSLWALLLAPELASARTLVDAETRVGVFEAASELCIRDCELANSSRHEESVDSSTEDSSRYPHATGGLKGAVTGVAASVLIGAVGAPVVIGAGVLLAGAALYGDYQNGF